MNKKRYVGTIILLTLALLSICVGCSTSKNTKYTLNELDNLAQIEVYSAERNELIKVVDDEEMLYQYTQCSFDSASSEVQQKKLEKVIEGIKEEYYINVYKYPTAHFGKKKLEKNTIITLYENSNIIKITVPEECIKGAYIPPEFLTFYYELSDKDMEFYHSLIEK